jgi:hypothetical protein
MGTALSALSIVSFIFFSAPHIHDSSVQTVQLAKQVGAGDGSCCTGVVLLHTHEQAAHHYSTNVMLSTVCWVSAVSQAG